MAGLFKHFYHVDIRNAQFFCSISDFCWRVCVDVNVRNSVFDCFQDFDVGIAVNIRVKPTVNSNFCSACLPRFNYSFCDMIDLNTLGVSVDVYFMNGAKTERSNVNVSETDVSIDHITDTVADACLPDGICSSEYRMEFCPTHI